MPRLFRILALVEIWALVSIVLVLLALTLKWSIVVSGELWTILTAAGTIGATAVALWLAYRGIRQERKSVAGLVSAWVTDDYLPNVGTQSYSRVVQLHIANESDQPVFDAHAVVIVGDENPLPLGPLSVPSLPVLAQRREQVFDISQPLRAHDSTWNPKAELSFTDPRGRRWQRDAAGKLSDITNAKAQWVAGSKDERQLGSMTLENPMALARWFLDALRDDGGVNMTNLQMTLAPEAAAGWSRVNWDEVRKEFVNAQPTSMVDYPAPYIARIKLALDTALEGMVVEGDHMMVRVKILTLTYAPDRGWRVWGIGLPVRPDQILFPPGTWE